MLDLLRLNDTDGQYPPSYYAATTDHLDPLSPAQGELRADVCIIGAGFTGLSAALHLAQAGLDVCVLEAQRVGFGASGRNGGQVGTGHNLDQMELEELVGLDDAKKLWSIAWDAVQLVRDLTADMPGTHFQDGNIHACHRGRFVPNDHRSVHHLQEVYGHTKLRTLNRDEMRDMVGSRFYFGGSIDTHAGHVEPLAYCLGLARKARAAGAKIHEGSRVTRIDRGDPAVVHTDQAQVAANHILLACNGYIGDLEPDIAARVMPINSFIAATEPLDETTRNGIIRGTACVHDSKFVVNYFRFSPDNRLLFGGRESYTYRFFDDIAEAVRRPLETVFPQLKGVRLDYGWGGTLGITLSRMPHFTRLSPNILSVSGFSGHGVALASMGGKLAAEALQGQAERFDLLERLPSSRFPGGDRLRGPLLVLAMLWYSLRDRM